MNAQQLRCRKNVSPLSRWETTAWMREVGQCRERLPGARVRGIDSVPLFPLTPNPLPAGERGPRQGYIVLIILMSVPDKVLLLLVGPRPSENSAPLNA